MYIYIYYCKINVNVLLVYLALLYIHMYIIYTVKSKKLLFFYVFERNLICSPKLHLFDQKYCNNSEILLIHY